jgi:hemolysin activation/secretion protein
VLLPRDAGRRQRHRRLRRGGLAPAGGKRAVALHGSEIYSFIDGTWVWNEPRGVLLLPKGRAASAGIGLRAHVMEKVQLQVECAAIIEMPRYTAGRDDWGLVFGVRSLL